MSTRRGAHRGRGGAKAAPAPAPGPDRFDLYEHCVQTPDGAARLLAAIHGGRPRVLREDFAGGGGICKAWVRAGRGRAGGREAIAVDHDPEPLRRLAGVEGVRTLCADVRRARARADVIAALNFPLGYFFERRDLVAYLRACRKRLLPRGVFVADTYGGRGAFDRATTSADFVLPGGERVRYTWEQREADPVRGRVVNALHFRVRAAGRRTRVLRDAFVYHWRLWSIPELVDACRDAGFGRVEVFDPQAGALDEHGRLHVRPVDAGEGLGEDWVVYVAARAG